MAVVVGAALGVIGSRVLFVGSALSLVPWSVAGLALGAWSTGYRQSLVVGAAFGFAVAFIFMASGYAGAAPLVTRLVPFAALGLVGAVCGLGLAVIGRAAAGAVARARRQG